MGRAPNSAWELDMADSGFRESFLDKEAHELYLGELLEFSDDKSGRKMFPPEGIAFSKTQRQEEARESLSLLCLGWSGAWPWRLSREVK